MSRCTSIDFDKDTDFIKFKEEAKAYAKANKVPTNTGKVILTVWKANSDRYETYYNKREFDSYA